MALCQRKCCSLITDAAEEGGAHDVCVSVSMYERFCTFPGAERLATVSVCVLTGYLPYRDPCAFQDSEERI